MKPTMLKQIPVATLLMALLGLSSCGIFQKSAVNKKPTNVPTDYNTKATTAQQAMVNYIDQFRNVAMQEQARAGIPASVTLAQGLLESAAGRSDLATQANNHFGIKCPGGWDGPTYYKKDDDKDAFGNLTPSCFRKYTTAMESYIGHTEFLRDPRKVNRYGSLFQIPPTDYEAWAQGLTRAGYSTNPDYGNQLVKIIEDYQLHQYDLMVMNPSPSTANNGGAPAYNPNGNYPNLPQAPTNLPSYNPNGNSNTAYNPGTATDGNNNGVRFIRAFGGLSLEQIAARNDVRLKTISGYNDDMIDATKPLPDGTAIFTQSKRGFSSEVKMYRVQPCETMFDVAQKFGVKLNKLLDRNHLVDGEQPRVGSQISLRRGWFERVPRPALRDTFGEWANCHKVQYNNVNPTTAGNKPSNGNNNGFEITPNGSPAGSTNYPQTQPTNYPSNTAPAQPNYYPTNDIPAGTTSYPSSTTSYPSGTTSYPSSTTSYPSGTTSYPSSTTSYPENTSGSTVTYPSSSSSGTTTGVRTESSTSSYPSYKPVQKPATPTPLPKPIPGVSKPTPGVPKPLPVPASNTYIVQPGETLWRISKQFGTTVEKLKALNNLPDNTLKVGQTLRVK